MSFSLPIEKVMASVDPINDVIDVRIISMRTTSHIVVVGRPNWVFHSVLHGERVPESVDPTLSFERGHAKLLMQALWDVGVRPERMNGSHSELDAVRNHLADMRRLAFAHCLPNRDQPDPEKPNPFSNTF